MIKLVLLYLGISFIAGVCLAMYHDYLDRKPVVRGLESRRVKTVRSIVS